MTASPYPQRVAIAGFLDGPHAVSRLIRILIRGMVEAGVEVDLLLPPGEPANRQQLGRVVRIYPLQPDDDETALSDLRSYLSERRPAAILSNRDRTSILLAGMEPKERPRTVLRIGTNVIEKLKKRNPFVRPKTRRRLAEAFSRADALIGISDGGCAALQELLKGREAPPIHRIYNCIDLDEAARLAREPVTHPWLLDKNKPVILSVGRLVRAKDYPTLLAAFRRVLDRQDCRLLILGEGRQRPKLEQLIERYGLAGRAALPGFDPNPFASMARADLFVLSSLFEGFGNVLVEALAAGLPCVATDCPSGPREILLDGRYGQLTPVAKASALADAIVATMRRPPEAALLQEAARRFAPEIAVPAYLRVLGVANSRGPGPANSEPIQADAQRRPIGT